MSTATIERIAWAIYGWLRKHYAGQNAFVACCTLVVLLMVAVGAIIANLEFVVAALSGGARVPVVEARVSKIEQQQSDNQHAIMLTLSELKTEFRGEATKNREWRESLQMDIRNLQAVRMSASTRARMESVADGKRID